MCVPHSPFLKGTDLSQWSYFFSIIENLNVLVAENMILVFRLPGFKEPYLHLLERAAYHPEILGSVFNAVTERYSKLVSRVETRMHLFVGETKKEDCSRKCW